MRTLHVIAGWTFIGVGIAVAVRVASMWLPFDGSVRLAADIVAGLVGAWIGWCVAGSPTLTVPLEVTRASWASLSDAGLLRGEGCALGAVRRRAWATTETLSHPRGHRLVLGAGAAADDAFIAAASRWPGALVFVDTTGMGARLSRDDVVRFAPGRTDSVRINLLLTIRRGAHAWRDASLLATGLMGAITDADAAAIATCAAVLLDHLHTAAPSDRTLDGVRRGLLDPERALATIVNSVHEQSGDGVWRAHPEIARMARIWRSDPVAARARFVDVERALRIFQDGRLTEVTAALDLRLADVASTGPKTLLVEAPPGDGARYGPVFAALLGQLVAHLTDATDTDGWGRVKTRRVLLAIDDPAVLGVIPLLAQRGGSAARCGLELLVRSATVSHATALFGAGARLSVFDAIAADGPLAANTADKLSAYAGEHAALQLRRGMCSGLVSRLKPVLALTSTPTLTSSTLKNAALKVAHLLLSGLPPARVRLVAAAAPLRGLRLRGEGLDPPSHDWCGAAAPSPVAEGRALTKASVSKPLPLFDAVTEEDEGEEAGAAVAPLTDTETTRRLRKGLSRGARTRRT